MPSGRICDTHVHVFDPQRFPYAPQRRFTPGHARVGLLQEHLRRLDAARVVLVQPSVYRHDHRCLQDALQVLRERARGVAVLAPDASTECIRDLDAIGVRATRINLVVDGAADCAQAEQAIRHAMRQIPSHWHVQLHIDLQLVQRLESTLANSPCHFVLDHMGLPAVSGSIHAPAWQALCALAAAEKATVKLSAPYLSLDTAQEYSTLRPWVESLAQANHRAIVWGSNWPHTQGTARGLGADPQKTEPFRQVDDRLWLRQCLAWLEALNLPASTLDDNAERLYEF